MPPRTRATAYKPATLDIAFESDYGSDIDEDTVANLLVQAESQLLTSLTLESTEEHNPLPQVVPLPNLYKAASSAQSTKTSVDEYAVTFEVPHNAGPRTEPSLEVEYDASERVAFSPQGDERQRRLFASSEEEPIDDSRSPLQRFRTKPKKPMSVTDLVSPAWCELQYFYSLSKYGRVKPTPAMKRGSSVHKVLEEEVHIAVPVQTVTREDMFGLRIWNIIQGLRTLRATGMTRELEVWGIVEGQVVNGVIDELSYQCPDESLESALAVRKKRGRPKKSDSAPDPNQSTLAFFLAKNTTDARPHDQAPASTTPVDLQAARTVFITDIKTRSSLSLPSDEVALRPTFIQLMLYRRLLTQLSLSEIPPLEIFARYRVDPSVPLSDTFTAQISGLDHNFPSSIPEDDPDYDPPSSAQDSLDELLSHNTLAGLWELMTTEFSLALPSRTLPTRADTIVSPLLQVEYRASGLARRGQVEVRPGQLLGRKMFVHDERRLEGYVRDEMAWWKGERAARGVEIEEAFKCRICSFAEGCEWREGKVEEENRRRAVRREGRVAGEGVMA